METKNNPQQEVETPASNTDAILSHLLHSTHKNGVEGNSIAENTLIAIARTGLITENGVIATARVIKKVDDLKSEITKSNETLKEISKTLKEDSIDKEISKTLKSLQEERASPLNVTVKLELI